MRTFYLLLCPVILGIACLSVRAEELSAFQNPSRNPVPIPFSERELPTVEATPLKIVNSANHVLEGAVFDKAGNLYFCDVTGGTIKKLTPDNELSDYAAFEEFIPTGLSFGPDGRLFMAAKSQEGTKGYILALSEPDKKVDIIVDADKGFTPNDLVFDKKGGIYFSDCKGSSTVTGGGIFYLAPDLVTITPVIPDMGQANGIAVSPDNHVVWATEYAKERLHKAGVRNSTELIPFRSHIPYRFTGRGPDSMRVDSEGNVYVAMMSQGRVLIFNSNGFPIGQILLPERDKGRNLLSTSLAVHPQKKEVRIVSGNDAESERSDAVVFTAPAFATGIMPNR